MDNLEIQGLEFQIKENSDSAVASLGRLEKALSSLKTATSGGASGVRTAAKQIAALNTALSGAGAVGQNLNLSLLVYRQYPMSEPLRFRNLLETICSRLGLRCLEFPMEI